MKIKACKKCGNTDISLYDCNYSSFNCYGGKCLNCDHKSGTQTGGCFPTKNQQISEWNKGQIPDNDMLKSERSKSRKLRNQLREKGIKPCV